MQHDKANVMISVTVCAKYCNIYTPRHHATPTAKLLHSHNNNMHHSLLLCGVSIVGALFLVIILLILKVLLTKLPHTTSTITIRYRSIGGGQSRSHTRLMLNYSKTSEQRTYWGLGLEKFCWQNFGTEKK